MVFVIRRGFIFYSFILFRYIFFYLVKFEGYANFRRYYSMK